MTTLTISHADWELLENLTATDISFSNLSSTQATVSMNLGGKAAVFTISGSFSSPVGLSPAEWLASVSGTVSAIALSIDGVAQFDATGLTLDASAVFDEAVDKIHDLVEMALGGEIDIEGSDDDDDVSGSTGDDSMHGRGGDDDLYGDLGDDSMHGGIGDDSLAGGSGRDSLYGDSGNDSLRGGSGDDSLYGGLGDDVYYVDSDLDRISETGGGGRDTEYSSVSESALASGVERLVLTGSALRGTGNGGNNTLTGNSANNVLNGGAGDDRLIGGRGHDRLNGGTGDDVFDFNSLLELGHGSGLRDSIAGFVRGDDRIDLSTIDAHASLAGNQAFRLVSSFSSNATGEIRYTDGVVYISTDADRSSEYEIELIGTPPARLSVGDFIL